MEGLNYKVLPPKVLKAIHYQVPQKRERLFLIGIRQDLHIDFHYPKPSDQILVLADALKAGKLYSTDVPGSPGQKYPEQKKKIMDLIPPGGYWRDLPEALQKAYMKQSYYLGGGKTGMARRIAWDEPCLTLTTSPAQKQTERCHPDESRPFTTREYARIQTFPDDWVFAGSMNQVYKQIGNAVPVNLGYAVAKEMVRALNYHTIREELALKFAS
jgi:DNA (cytosine-5)-methyltransferase 1